MSAPFPIARPVLQRIRLHQLLRVLPQPRRRRALGDTGRSELPSQRSSPAAMSRGSVKAGRGRAPSRPGRLFTDREAILHVVDARHGIDHASAVTLRMARAVLSSFMCDSFPCVSDAADP